MHNQSHRHQIKSVQPSKQQFCAFCAWTKRSEILGIPFFISFWRHFSSNETVSRHLHKRKRLRGLLTSSHQQDNPTQLYSHTKLIKDVYPEQQHCHCHPYQPEDLQSIQEPSVRKSVKQLYFFFSFTHSNVQLTTHKQFVPQPHRCHGFSLHKAAKWPQKHGEEGPPS